MMHMRRTLGGIQRLGRPILDFGTEPRFGNIDMRPTRALLRRRIPSMRKSAESPHARQGRREGNSPPCALAEVAPAKRSNAKFPDATHGKRCDASAFIVAPPSCSAPLGKSWERSGRSPYSLNSR